MDVACSPRVCEFPPGALVSSTVHSHAAYETGNTKMSIGVSVCVTGWPSVQSVALTSARDAAIDTSTPDTTCMDVWMDSCLYYLKSGFLKMCTVHTMGLLIGITETKGKRKKKKTHSVGGPVSHCSFFRTRGSLFNRRSLD